MRDGTYTGAVDRIVDGETAVILLEADGDVVEELTVSVEDLPDETREDGGVLSVEMADGEVVFMEYLPAKTEERRDRLGDKLDRLSERLSDREQ